MNWKEIIVEDTKRWASMSGTTCNMKFFIKTFLHTPEFRRLIHYRIKYTPLRFLRPLTKIVSDGINCYLWTKEIGPGLKIDHGFSTIVSAKSIGKNFRLFQQVTIGWGGGMDTDGNHVPTIGDDVTIHPGAKIFGGIRIGNDVEIGANAVVIRDVPDHSIVAGVPAKIIKTRVNKNHDWHRL